MLAIILRDAASRQEASARQHYLREVRGTRRERPSFVYIGVIAVSMLLPIVSCLVAEFSVQKW